MRLELVDGEESIRGVGAAVVRQIGMGEIVLELGPADGAPKWRLKMSVNEAARLMSAVQSVTQGGGESVLIVET